MIDRIALDIDPVPPPARPATLVVFGATGDLSRRKLIPALYNLDVDGRLPANLTVVAVARRDFTDATYRASVREDCARFLSERPGERAFDDGAWSCFERRLTYLRGDFADKATYRALPACYADCARDLLFYMACAPDAFATVARGLAAVGLGSAGRSLLDKGPWRRLVVEKPYGYDQASAGQLNHALSGVFDEDDIFRVDHYLGKEAVQNLLYFRFANSIFEPAWNRRFVERVDIRVLEQGGIGGRGGYYDGSGALRDMVQNHLMQILCLMAMEPPASLAPEAVREQKVRVLRSVPVYEPAECLLRSVRGQYSGYRAEPLVTPASCTETFAAIRLGVDNWRWAGVPFVLSSGKALRERRAEIVVRFRQPSEPPFSGILGEPASADELVVDLRPEAGISISFNARPAEARNADAPSVVRETFRYSVDHRSGRVPEAYERLILDALEGDPTLFTRFDEVEEAWRIADAFGRAWALKDQPPVPYDPGSDGPDLSALNDDERFTDCGTSRAKGACGLNSGVRTA